MYQKVLVISTIKKIKRYDLIENDQGPNRHSSSSIILKLRHK